MGEASPLGLGSPRSQTESGIFRYRIDFGINKIEYITTDKKHAEVEISEINKHRFKELKELCDKEIASKKQVSGGRAYVSKTQDEKVYYVFEDAPKPLLDEIRKFTGEPDTPSGDVTPGSAGTFRTFGSFAGSRRRRLRPSRKYKKSKRVLRRKSRSTRRR